MNEISNVAIIQRQNELMKIKDDRGQTYLPTYLCTIHAQLSSILNHACRYYNLKTNVARDLGTMGEKEADEILYWCGLRMGELLTLTKEKFDFKTGTIKIDESLQRIDGKNIITPPKNEEEHSESSYARFLG